jgi:hypothetical protein
MKSNFLLLTLLFCLISCKQGENVLPDQIAKDAIKMIVDKFDDYHKGNWEKWAEYYVDSAKIYYNTRTKPMTAIEAAKMHENSVVPLSEYKFADNMLIEKVNTEDRPLKLLFKGYWQATLKGNGESFEVPSLVYYIIVDGKILEEHGFWDNSIYTNAYVKMMAEKQK